MSSGSETPSKRRYSRITTSSALNVRPLSNDRRPSPLTPKCSMNPHLASSSIVFARVAYPACLTSLAPEGEHPLRTATEALGEDAIIHALDTRRPDPAQLWPFGPLLALLHT